MKSLDTNNKFQSGWKLRKSVKGVDRKLWDGKNKLSVEIHELAEEWFTNNSVLQNYLIRILTALNHCYYYKET